MKKRALCAALALVLVLASAVPAAAASGLDNFSKYLSYGGQFSDVSSGAWYYPYVRDAYAYGLVSGRSSTQFAPDGEMTLAEVITLASRIHSVYTGTYAVFQVGDPWYSTYVAYAKYNGIISEGEYEGYYDRSATRAQVADILCSAVPASALPAINDVSGTIPNLNGGGSITQFASHTEIRRLYAAGVLTGMDSYGSFQGLDTVKRSEVATLICRIVDASQRKTFTLPALSVEEVLVNGYWMSYGVTNGTIGVYRFYSDGSCSAEYTVSSISSTYTLKNGVLNISGYGISDMRYDATYGIFGMNVKAMVQGVTMTVNALSPISKARYDEIIAGFYQYFR